jgi:hypothetical protein
MLLAAAIDELAVANWMYQAAHSGSSAGRPPERIPRPGVSSKPKAKARYTLEQARKLDPRMRRKQGEEG